VTGTREEVMFAAPDELKGKSCLVDVDVTLCEDILDSLNANR